jgi:hypothetical protein
MEVDKQQRQGDRHGLERRKKWPEWMVSFEFALFLVEAVVVSFWLLFLRFNYPFRNYSFRNYPLRRPSSCSNHGRGGVIKRAVTRTGNQLKIPILNSRHGLTRDAMSPSKQTSGSKSTKTTRTGEPQRSRMLVDVEKGGKWPTAHRTYIDCTSQSPTRPSHNHP